MHTVAINVSSGHLQGAGLLSLPDTPTRPPCVMVLGAHPKYGGERKGDAATAISDALLKARFATLRLEYGGDTKTQVGQDAELEYALAALQEMALHNLVDGSSMGVAGYAFGASIALRAAQAGVQVHAVAAIAPPARTLTETASAEILAHKLVVGAGQDHDLPAQQFRFLAGRLSEPIEIEEIRDADHFFTNHGEQLSQIVVGFFERNLRGQVPGKDEADCDQLLHIRAVSGKRAGNAGRSSTPMPGSCCLSPTPCAGRKQGQRSRDCHLQGSGVERDCVVEVQLSRSRRQRRHIHKWRGRRRGCRWRTGCAQALAWNRRRPTRRSRLLVRSRSGPTLGEKTEVGEVPRARRPSHQRCTIQRRAQIPCQPMLFVAGDRDRISPAAELQRALDDLQAEVGLYVVRGADHSMTGAEVDVANRVAQFIADSL